MDIDTGNKNEITITNHSRLSKEEVDRLLEEAQKYKAEDERYLKKVRAKNALENYATSTLEKLRDYAEKIGVDDRKRMESTIEMTIGWLDWNFQLAQASKFEEKMKDLQAFCEPIIAQALKPVVSTVCPLAQDDRARTPTRKQFGRWTAGISGFMKFLGFGKNEGA